MTRQYVAGELSVLLGHVQAVAVTEAAERDAWALRHAAETEPIPALAAVTARALALIESLCWDSLNRGDTWAFTRQAAVGAELHEFGVCSGLLTDDKAGPNHVPGRNHREKNERQGNGRRPGAAGP